jgi:hypothetical protein
LAASAALIAAGLASIASRLIFAPEGPYGAGYTVPPAFVAGSVMLDLGAVALIAGGAATVLAWKDLPRHRERLIVTGYCLAAATFVSFLVRWQLVGVTF